MIGSFNYLMGIMLSFKLAKFIPNPNSKYNIVFPRYQDYYFQGTNEVDDYQETIYGTMGSVFVYEPGQGIEQNGCYQIFFPGTITYEEA